MKGGVDKRKFPGARCRRNHLPSTTEAFCVGAGGTKAHTLGKNVIDGGKDAPDTFWCSPGQRLPGKLNPFWPRAAWVGNLKGRRMETHSHTLFGAYSLRTWGIAEVARMLQSGVGSWCPVVREIHWEDGVVAACDPQRTILLKGRKNSRWSLSLVWLDRGWWDFFSLGV